MLPLILTTRYIVFAPSLHLSMHDELLCEEKSLLSKRFTSLLISRIGRSGTTNTCKTIVKRLYIILCMINDILSLISDSLIHSIVVVSTHACTC